jgi:6-phosphogluconolactonase
MKRANAFLAIALGAIGLVSCQKDKMTTESETIPGNSETAAMKQADNSPGAVYVLSNSTMENRVLVYTRSSSGLLTWSGSYATGGKGTGGGLGSQGAVILDGSNQHLYAVNAGSNEISVFNVEGNSLAWVSKVNSGGLTPISLTIDQDILYVLNAGGSGNIQGFKIENDHLTPIAGSSQPLSSSTAAPAQIEFNNTGTHLVVTEKATNTIDVYTVTDGVAGARVSYPSVGETPFGFAFGKKDELIVSDAYGGMPGLSALTAYSLSKSGSLSLINGPVGTTQTAACWVVITNSGRYAYTSNTGSASISGYRIANDGTISMLNANGVTATTGTSPSDMALSNNSRFLYARNGGSNSISMYEVEASGALTGLGSVSGLPAGAVGLAAK